MTGFPIPRPASRADGATAAETAFRALFAAHYAAVCAYVARRARPDAVEDVAADTFLIAWRRQAEIPDRPRPWLLATAGKCLANQRRALLRGDALAQRLAATLPPAAPDAAAGAEQAAHRRALIAAFTALDDADRELLMLSHWDGLAPRDVAAVLGVSPVAARARVHRANRRLQQRLRLALDGAAPQPAPIPLHAK